MNYRSILIVCLATLGLAVAGWGQADGKIAFISYREGPPDVWIMNADGSDPVNLTRGRYCDGPAWSPDGTKIAYVDIGADYSGTGIWVMDADGGNPQQVADDLMLETPQGIRDLFWSEDGSSIYYTVHLRAHKKPDGSFLLESPDLFVAALDGSGSSLIERGEGTSMHRQFLDDRSRSPDGTRRAFVVLRDGATGQAFLHIRNANEDEFTAIPLSDLPNVEPFPWSPPDATRVPYLLAWAPNSMRVAFSSYATINSTRDIWAVDIDGSNLVNLTNGLGGRYPAWQPVVPAATATSVESQSWGRIKSLLSVP